MYTYDRIVDELSELETFDPQVFVGDDAWPQQVCDFVLSLAVVFNDLRDLVQAQKLLYSVERPAAGPSPAAGQFGGVHVHLTRLVLGTINELAVLIENNRKAVESRAITRLVKSMPPAFRGAWTRTIAAALSARSRSDTFGRLVHDARNAVAYHYSHRAIAQGFARLFLAGAPQAPFVSRGRNMAGTRFYFADAAAEAHMMHIVGATTGAEFFAAGWRVLPDLGHALRHIVTSFVNARGFAWREPTAT